MFSIPLASLLAPFWFRWTPVDSVLTPFGLPWAPVGSLLVSSGLQFGALGLIFARLGTQFSHFGNFHAYFQIFLHMFDENLMPNHIHINIFTESQHFLILYATELWLPMKIECKICAY